MALSKHHALIWLANVIFLLAGLFSVLCFTAFFWYTSVTLALAFGMTKYASGIVGIAALTITFTIGCWLVIRTYKKLTKKI